MRRLSPTRRSFRLVNVCLAAATLAACSSAGPATGPSGSGGGSGGTSSSGGSTGSGGATGSGGVTSSGGSSASGGAVGSGGVTATGGVTASGGAKGSGGVQGSGGVASTGSGGAVASGGVTSAGGATASGGVTPTGGAVGAGGAKGGSSGGGGNSGAGGGASTCPAGTPLKGGTQYCSNSKGNSSGGYTYELWSDGTGSGCMNVYGSGAAFSANWTNAGDFLARVGLNFDQTKTPSQIGTLSSDFAETKTGNGLVYVGIYGWTVSPLREYYIIDDWGDSKPAGTASDGTPRTHIGVITVDGDTYDVWKRTKTNAPAITGDNQTFDQYFSVRQTARQCGHISISEHFSQWATLGLQLGKMEEAKLLLEAQDSTGKIDFTKATVVVK